MEQILMLLIYISAFTGVFLLTVTFLNVLSSRLVLENMGNQKIDARNIELKETLRKRMFGDLWGTLSNIGRRLSPHKRLKRIEKNLIIAGSPRKLNLDKFLALKVITSLIFSSTFLLLLTLFHLSFSLIFLFTLVTLAGGYYLPDLYIYRLINLRKHSIRRSLPDTLDLLTISVEAGLGFDAALKKVVKKTNGPLPEEFRRMLKEIQLGSSRREAFQNLAKRTEVNELDSFILAMLQADVFGIRIGKVLRVQASEMRTKRRQEAEEIAMKAPVKIVFPLVFCIFPALLAVVLGPAAISIYEAMIMNL